MECVVRILPSGLGVAMFEHASGPVWAVTVLLPLPALLGLVQTRQVGLHHQLALGVGERAVIAKSAFAGRFKVLAHLGSELADVWSGRSQLYWVT